jgi:hypothetical protein
VILLNAHLLSTDSIGAVPPSILIQRPSRMNTFSPSTCSTIDLGRHVWNVGYRRIDSVSADHQVLAPVVRWSSDLRYTRVLGIRHRLSLSSPLPSRSASDCLTKRTRRNAADVSIYNSFNYLPKSTRKSVTIENFKLLYFVLIISNPIPHL